MKTIEINSKKHGIKKLLLDDQDYETAINYTWGLSKHPHTFYACTHINKVTVNIHRLLFGKPGKVIDHIDGNGLNNQRSNIRICTQGQNVRNMGLSKKNTSGFKGVCCSEVTRGRYVAGIYINNKRKHIGSFDTAIEAAKAYNEAAKKYHGEFAKLNDLSCVA